MFYILYFILSQKVVIDTRSIATHLRENLSNLGTYMSTVNSVLENFNQYFKVKVDGLKTRGESIDDSMVNLFKAYHVASDGEFVRYTKAKKYQYDDIYNISIE